jgi:ABC-type uncharacterized transport system involved in gliding motility auxiliary subunit
MSTMDTSSLWNPPVLNSETASTFQPSSSDKKGPFVVLAKSSNAVIYNNGFVASNVLVSGSTDAFNVSDLLSSTTFTNSDVMLDSVNSLVGFTSPINVEAKTTDSTQLNISAAQQQVMVAIFIYAIPIAILLIGLIVWLRRRHL